MARNQRKYDAEYKVQAVKLSKEIGSANDGLSPALKRRRYYDSLLLAA